MSKLFDLLVRLYTFSPLLGTVLQTALTLAIATFVGRRMLAALRERSKRLSPGPVLLFAALLTALGFCALLAYLAATGRSFEQALVEWLTGAEGAPIEQLGAHRHPVVLGIAYMLLYSVFVLVALVTAWLLGLTRGDGGVAREVEAALGTSCAERFYRLAGHIEAGAAEARFYAWNKPLLGFLRWAQYLSLPAAVTGAVAPPVWAVLAIVIEGVALNLVLPPRPPEEKARKKAAPPALEAGVRDPEQLVRALSADPRGPRLEVRDGGFLPGNGEHRAARTRVAEESAMLGDVIEGLGIEGFYVHQEAAVEAILGEKNVLMETAPASGRRTLCDLLALRAVLLEGGSVLYLSPDAAESARRALAFREIARRSGWRWAIHLHDLASSGRRGLDLRARQPQIVFATPEELHQDLCAKRQEWDAFLWGLSLVVAIDLDRYTGATGANLMYVMRRLHRAAALEGGKPKVLCTVAPYGPDVLGFCERLMGASLTVVGPESDSRGAPPQQVLVARPRAAAELHPAVAARGVAIACGYAAESWGFGSVLSSFEQEQQVNRVLLTWGKAVINPGDDSQLRLDSAEALVTRLSAGKAAMLGFFTRHAGRSAIGVFSAAAEEVGARRAGPTEVELPFGGFEKPKAEVKPEPEASKEDEADEAEETDEASEAPALVVRADRMVDIWIPDPDPMSQLLGRHPVWLHPQSLHPMLGLGSSLVATPDNLELAERHLRCAVAEAPLLVSDALRDFPAQAVTRLVEAGGAAGVTSRRRRLLSADGTVREDQELSLAAELASRGSTLAASSDTGTVIDRADGEVVVRTDRARIAAVAYPGRVSIVGGRRYRVLLPDEQPELERGVLYAEPERRRLVTSRVRRLDFELSGQGNELHLGGGSSVRFHQPRGELVETVLGVRIAHEARASADELSYPRPIEVRYPTRVAALHLPGARPEALHALEHLVRATLPAFVRHAEDDLDVTWRGGDDPALVVVDRHPGEVGFARVVTSEVLRHVLFWSREIARECGGGAACERDDGCRLCVADVCLSPRDEARPSKRAVLALLGEVLG